MDLISCWQQQSIAKSTISESVRTLTREENKKPKQMTRPFCLFERYLFVTLILLFKISQNSFSCASNGGSLWSGIYLNFGQKLTALTHAFLERRHPMGNLNPFYVLSTETSHKKLSAHGLNMTIIYWKLRILIPFSSLVSEL